MFLEPRAREIGKDVSASFTLISVRNATLKGCTEGLQSRVCTEQGKGGRGGGKKGPYSDQPTTDRAIGSIMS